MFHMETVYLQMAANQERVKDDLRRRHEYDHPESGSARARSSHEDVPWETSPYAGIFPDGPWRIERWRGAGW